MKKIKILSLCLALSLSVCLFAGCTNRDDTKPTDDSSATSTQATQDSDLELVEGQDQEIEINEGNEEDPFGA
ncbi:MAG: hypothetical protein HFG44_06360 [Oscillospiraceae bacterium]|nr:hypothetical protein [Oscillospiraceae bacterium]